MYLELKATGLFSMVDEEINVPKGSDEGFLAKAFKVHSSHPNLSKPKPKDCIEVIIHFRKKKNNNN